MNVSSKILLCFLTLYSLSGKISQSSSLENFSKGLTDFKSGSASSKVVVESDKFFPDNQMQRDILEIYSRFPKKIDAWHSFMKLSEDSSAIINLYNLKTYRITVNKKSVRKKIYREAKIKDSARYDSMLTIRGRKKKVSRALSQFTSLVDVLQSPFLAKDLPLQYSALPLIESLMTFPRSWAGAVGPWQQIKDLASKYVKINKYVDMRNSWVGSSLVATNHLFALHNVFDGYFALPLNSYIRGLYGTVSDIEKMLSIPEKDVGLFGNYSELVKFHNHSDYRKLGFEKFIKQFSLVYSNNKNNENIENKWNGKYLEINNFKVFSKLTEKDSLERLLVDSELFSLYLNDVSKEDVLPFSRFFDSSLNSGISRFFPDWNFNQNSNYLDKKIFFDNFELYKSYLLEKFRDNNFFSVVKIDSSSFSSLRESVGFFFDSIQINSNDNIISSFFDFYGLYNFRDLNPDLALQIYSLHIKSVSKDNNLLSFNNFFSIPAKSDINSYLEYISNYFHFSFNHSFIDEDNFSAFHNSLSSSLKSDYLLSFNDLFNEKNLPKEIYFALNDFSTFHTKNRFETPQYVFRFVAYSLALSNPEKFGFSFEKNKPIKLFEQRSDVWTMRRFLKKENIIDYNRHLRKNKNLPPDYPFYTTSKSTILSRK